MGGQIGRCPGLLTTKPPDSPCVFHWDALPGDVAKQLTVKGYAIILPNELDPVLPTLCGTLLRDCLLTAMNGSSDCRDYLPECQRFSFNPAVCAQHTSFCKILEHPLVNLGCRIKVFVLHIILV